MKKQNVTGITFKNTYKDFPFTASSTCKLPSGALRINVYLVWITKPETTSGDCTLSLTCLPPLPPPSLPCRVMAYGWSTRWNWPMGSRSGRSISLQTSSVRVIRRRDYGANRRWHKPTALSTANKARWTEQITIMKERQNELMMTDEVKGRAKKTKWPE